MKDLFEEKQQAYLSARFDRIESVINELLNELKAIKVRLNMIETSPTMQEELEK